MLAIFLLVVILITFRLYCKFDDMLVRHDFQMTIARDLEIEEVELLKILMRLICITAFTLFTLGGFNLLPNYF